MKVTGLNIIEEIINSEMLAKKIEKDVRNDKIKQLMVQGIDEQMAKVMVDAFTNCGIA